MVQKCRKYILTINVNSFIATETKRYFEICLEISNSMQFGNQMQTEIFNSKYLHIAINLIICITCRFSAIAIFTGRPNNNGHILHNNENADTNDDKIDDHVQKITQVRIL